MESNHIVPQQISTASDHPTLAATKPIPLTLSRYQFIFDPFTRNALPGFTGSTWRGAFGHALKKACCLTPNTACKQCLLQHNCAYSTLFEASPPPDSERMRLYPSVPAPYLIEPEETFTAKNNQAPHYTLGMTLFGKANEALPYIVNAMHLMAESGIGKGCPPTRLAEIKRESTPDSDQWQTLYPTQQTSLPKISPSSPEIPAIPESMIIKLLTPMRLRKEDKYISPETFHLSDLISNLLRRISSLSYFHNQQPLQENFRQLTLAAQSITLDRKELIWWDWQRYSSRQCNKIKMGGLVGNIQVPAEQLKPFWPYLWLGQWTHAGKGTTMGLGKYQISTTDNNK